MYMKPTLLTAAAALSAGVAADFLVITDYPQALQTLSPAQADAWIASNLPSIQAEFASLATDTSYLNAAASVIPELRGFAATATQSIPAVVTAIDDFTIFTSPPAWYTQLPSGVRSFYDDAAKRVESYVSANAPSNVPANATSVMSSASASASASESASLSSTVSTTPSGSAASASGSDVPESTGAAGAVEVRVLGAGVVAGVLGLALL